MTDKNSQCPDPFMQLYVACQFQNVNPYQAYHPAAASMPHPPPPQHPGSQQYPPQYRPQQYLLPAPRSLEEEGNFDRVNAADNSMLDPGAMQKLSKHELERKRRRDMVRASTPNHTSREPHSHCGSNSATPQP